MEFLVDYFSTIPSSHRALLLAGGIAFFWLAESAVPLFRFSYQKWQHAGINLFFTATTIVVNFSLAFLLLQTAAYVTNHRIGLLQMIPEIPLWLFALAGLLLLDLIGAYAAHYFEHRIPVLWRFHLVHHTDTWIDTTTANRHHPGESVIRFVFTLAGVVLTGAPMWLVFLYQSLSVVLSQFNHANISLPEKVDTALSLLLVSPNMHKVHHHYKLPYTDSNYGNIFSIWDRLFGTFRYLKPGDIVYGVDTHPDPREHNRLANLLQIPLQPRRKPSAE